MRTRPAFLLAALLATSILSACGEDEEDEGPLMAPGSACIDCHGEFTAAGTVYGGGEAAAGAGLAGATVRITDSSGTVRTLTTNAAGNFFTSRSVVPPFAVRVSLGADERTATGHTSGDCGACHQPGGAAPSRVHVGSCATCHSG
jgi:hypothetical protein